MKWDGANGTARISRHTPWTADRRRFRRRIAVHFHPSKDVRGTIILLLRDHHPGFQRTTCTGNAHLLIIQWRNNGRLPIMTRTARIL